ncbi:hypothetical protein HCB18_27475 [Salinispora arenicola]|nr:hypothetical protein [Salinispora arenicola]
MARYIAIKLRRNVAYFTFEMSNGEVFDRILSAETGVPHRLIRDGMLEEEEWSKVASKIAPMSNAPLFLTDKAPMTVANIKDHCKRQQDGPGLDGGVVDHMHLTLPSNPKIVDRTAIMADVSPALKLMGQELDVPVVAAAQLNRGAVRTPGQTARVDRPQGFVIDRAGLKRGDPYPPARLLRPRAHRAEVRWTSSSPRTATGEKGVVTLAAQLHLSRFVDMAAL